MYGANAGVGSWLELGPKAMALVRIFGRDAQIPYSASVQLASTQISVSLYRYVWNGGAGLVLPFIPSRNGRRSTSGVPHLGLAIWFSIDACLLCMSGEFCNSATTPIQPCFCGVPTWSLCPIACVVSLRSGGFLVMPSVKA